MASLLQSRQSWGKVRFLDPSSTQARRKPRLVEWLAKLSHICHAVGDSLLCRAVGDLMKHFADLRRTPVAHERQEQCEQISHIIAPAQANYPCRFSIPSLVANLSHGSTAHDSGGTFRNVLVRRLCNYRKAQYVLFEFMRSMVHFPSFGLMANRKTAFAFEISGKPEKVALRNVKHGAAIIAGGSL